MKYLFLTALLAATAPFSLRSQTMTVDGAGRVGVRETGPEYTLHVTHGNGTPAAAAGNGIAIEHDAGPQWVLYVSNTGSELRFYRNGIQEVTFDDDGSVNTLSDERSKSDIAPLPDGQLATVLALSPKTYRYVRSSSGRMCAGFLAQELHKVLPQAVRHTVSDDDGQETWMVSYQTLLPYVVKAIQEQQSLIERQQTEIELLKRQQADILARLAKLEKP